MLRIAICDDNRLDVERLEAALDTLSSYSISYDVYFSADELLKYTFQNKESYHLYIFDIEMPGMTGLELAREIRKNGEKALFVFLTGYTEYVMEAFDVITFDYISKPITAEKLESVLVKAMNYLNMVKQDFTFRYGRKQFRVSCGDILYFEKKGRLAVIHTIPENFKTNMTVSELWKQLDERVFTQIHASYIINMEHLRSVEGDEAVMDNGDRLLISHSHRQEIREKHMAFMRRMI